MKANFLRGMGALGGLGVASVAGVASTAPEDTAPAQPSPALDRLEDLEAPTGPRRTKRRTGRAAASKPLPNPGKYEEHQKECKGVRSVGLCFFCASAACVVFAFA